MTAVIAVCCFLFGTPVLIDFGFAYTPWGIGFVAGKAYRMYLRGYAKGVRRSLESL